ncbi:MAG TPA: peptidylprolyl isomerase [Kofleriaceae bacterium]|nr:peptidylprolyl isomerase [Kofleriaceae bacterium]
MLLLLIGTAGCQKPTKDQTGGSAQGSGQTAAKGGSGSGAVAPAVAGQGSGSAAGSGSAVPAVPAKDIDSKDILARTETFPEVQVKHVLLAWNGMAMPRGQLDPRAAKRSNDETAKLAQDIAGKLKANPDQIDELVKQYSEDPGSASGDPYTVKADSPFVPEFKNLAIRLKEKEVGIVKTAFGYHVIERVPPPPPDPLESADVLAREPEAGPVYVQQILIGWKDTMLAKSGRGDPRSKDRSKADADKLLKEVLDKARPASADMAKLMKQYSEDPTAKDSARVDQITSDMQVNQLFDAFKKLVLRLKVGEVGAVKSPLGWHLVKRVAPPPPDPLESAAILKRDPQTQSAKVKHILLGWTGAHPPDDEKGAKRDRPALDKLVKDTVAKLTKGAKIEPLMAELSEDPGSAKTGMSYDVTPTAGLVPPFKNLSLRLKVGEVGVVKSDYGIHIIQRVE